MQLLQQKLLWLSAWCIYIINTSRFSFLSKFTFIYEIPRWLSGKESATNAEDMGLIPRLGRSLGKENGNLFQYKVCFLLCIFLFDYSGNMCMKMQNKCLTLSVDLLMFRVISQCLTNFQWWYEILSISILSIEFYMFDMF